MRRFNTIRISVTGRCDLDCVYCNAEGLSRAGAPAAKGLSPEEIARLAEAARLAGARTVRLTGGEPLLRDDIEDIICRVRATDIDDIALTTNAGRLGRRARALAEAGLDRVNIGLPSLRPETDKGMTGGELAPALEGLEAALGAGLRTVKLNVVVIGGRNAEEIGDFVDLARRRPVEVRFIERMPFAGADSLVPAAEVLRRIAASVGAEAMGPPEPSPTSELYRPRGFAGSVGTISPVTEPFCGRCDRLRVTSDGRLRACLSEPAETDLRDLLREGASVETLAREFRSAFDRKPERHSASFSGAMRRIGG